MLKGRWAVIAVDMFTVGRNAVPRNLILGLESRRARSNNKRLPAPLLFNPSKFQINVFPFDYNRFKLSKIIFIKRLC